LDRLTALVVSPFCVFHKVLLLPTYSWVYVEISTKFLVLVKKKRHGFLTRAKRNLLEPAETKGIGRRFTTML
jgi:hypothetical protein